MSTIFQFNWDNLPDDLRVGKKPDEILTVYRGFSPDQLNPVGDMLSTALAQGRIDLVNRVILAIQNKDWKTLMAEIGKHTARGRAEENAEPSPFLSTTERTSIAERYARQTQEQVATIQLSADRLIRTPLLPYEVLVLGVINHESIFDTNKGVVDEITTSPEINIPVS